MGLVIDIVALGQVYLQVHWVSPVSIVPTMFRTHFHASAIDVM